MALPHLGVLRILRRPSGRRIDTRSLCGHLVSVNRRVNLTAMCHMLGRFSSTNVIAHRGFRNNGSMFRLARRRRRSRLVYLSYNGIVRFDSSSVRTHRHRVTTGRNVHLAGRDLCLCNRYTRNSYHRSRRTRRNGWTDLGRGDRPTN